MDLCHIVAKRKFSCELKMKMKMKMNLVWFLPLVFLCLGAFPFGHGKNVSSSSRPAVVNIGAIFIFNSTIGRVAKIAIEEAVKDVNSNSSILPGTKLEVKMQNSNCSGFLGMIDGTLTCTCLFTIVCFGSVWCF